MQFGGKYVQKSLSVKPVLHILILYVMTYIIYDIIYDDSF